MSKVRFITSVKAKKSTPLLKLSKKADIEIKTSCLKGKCGKCVIKVKGDVSEPTKNEIRTLGKEKIDKGYRLACEVEVTGDVDIHIPCKK
ncbi:MULTISPECIES: 2Fe-2S iron-sulfur cluster-binding protein [unclassified Fusibacter]|uniref:2Fe-2S iron-sulfur cluster-binding protein n=1 Tax=unclassified Fusibacter TaxID=2624464 RepID=UPI001011E2EF|nr:MULTISPECIES: 2Fe-2S iron-sulfur cluster-binding protein [unclassified Fusibacter]MCK8061445.1 (2Fe-2S)-binding protein [Fusibacter sp. A2]NPE23632.1 (2Fe-2S)-binding protein [Fusibacter sp. A1]RXV58905.1 (2Fe-2S)-binding protein [Fusibacter sp. A1]